MVIRALTQNMPARRHTPPACLQGRCFTTEQALQAGVSYRQLRGPAYRSILTGVWATSDHELPEHPKKRTHQVMAALQMRHPTTVVSHTSSALLLGLPLPGAVWQSPGLHITRWDGLCPPRMTGVIGHKAEVAQTDRGSIGGVLVTGPALTAVQLADQRSTAGGLALSDDALVALLDGVVTQHSKGFNRGNPPTRNLNDLVSDLERLSPRRGLSRLWEALKRVSVGADSALETHARLALAKAGFTLFVHDLEIRVPGMRPVHPDLGNVELRISIQVEGPHHDSPGQRVRDIERLRVTEAAGWIEIRVTAADIFTRPGDLEPRLVSLVRAAVASRR